MLKDIFKKKKKDKRENEKDDFSIKLKGKLEITARKNGKVIYEDVGDNLVTIWAKHSTMHMLTGENFGYLDSEPLEDVGYKRGITGHSTTENPDGNIISTEQYFSSNAKYHDGTDYKYLSTPNIAGAADADVFPYFPTKILFGTGKEFSEWTEMTPEEQAAYTDAIYGGWADATAFDSEISNPENAIYSNKYNGNDIVPCRTVNEINSGPTTSTVAEDDFGITGAIKDSTIRDDTEIAAKTVDNDFGNKVADLNHRGIGKPAFIYAERDRFFSDGGIRLNSNEEGTMETKLSFTFTMPQQSSEEFYPHNGYTMKVAGLFCDMRLFLNNEIPTAGSDLEAYKKMPCGIMFAKRRIAPLFKDHETEITARWTIYLP